jgi:hypothetical protein
MGFDPHAFESWLLAAQLSLVSSSEVPPAFHVSGPDKALDWHAWVAVKPHIPNRSKP